MSDTQFDLIVIGAGPGGYVAAIRAAQLGLKTAIVEEQHLGGICLNWGCIPTKALLSGAALAQQFKHSQQFGFSLGAIDFDIQQLVRHSRQVSEQLVQGIRQLLKKNQVTVFNASAQFIAKERLELTDTKGQKQQISAPHIIVATGARAANLAHVPVDGQHVWSYKEALVPEQLPKSLLVIGSGAIGSEFASLYQDLGCQVTLVDIAKQILPSEDLDVAKYVQKQFEQHGMTVLTEAAVQNIEIDKGQVHCHVETATGVQTITVEKVLSAIGVQPNTQNLGLETLGIEFEHGFIKVDPWCKTNVVGVYAIGDVAGAPCLAHKASHEAILCVEKIAGLTHVHVLDRSQIPGCIFTHPQVASIGLSEQKAKAAGFTINVGKFPLQANGKALALGETTRFVKTIFNQETGELLGAHMVGHEVTEHIQGFAIAKYLEATDESLAQVIFPHPTLSEAMHESVLSAMQRAIHI
ncbi:Dihydrolipoamide dehydrogenase of acetoin dehydrogenase [Acinetobacter guillouiae MSP4-18]|uniref:dihydrolipoyl dehydrogenase n=2 Tax=Acinetobacter TaxID=469 RepID=UPI0002CEC289|nr:dihydrolipoyl dehydrogenase [Acinetobacter guillouiae]ENU60564.1 dihydrolipoyl dehydrogenase [Acinetobacter guillouiae CIP 63.46]EPH36592.1 Dihydrolipoamide dehydrogenase of acetoin dehydrogenase [Acinetobacter guillouiae MSP4-18]KAB0629995.1 dihydrolipoyl dehydrogenase [Acinetobacter guillouiae]